VARAQAMRLSMSAVHAVASFYHHFDIGVSRFDPDPEISSHCRNSLHPRWRNTGRLIPTL